MTTVPVDTASRSLRRDAARNVEKILAAAMEAFAERGLAVSMADVAERAAVGVGTVYRRFGDKQGLVDAVFTAKIEEVTRLAWSAARQGDAVAAFVEFASSVAEHLASNKGLRQIMLGEDFRPSDTHAAALDQLTSQTAVLVRKAKRTGWLRKDFSATDFPLILMAIGAVRDFGGTQHPELWRRLLGLTIDGMHTDPHLPISLDAPPALTRQQLHAATSADERRQR